MQTFTAEWKDFRGSNLKNQETRVRTLIAPLGVTKGAVQVRSVPYSVNPRLLWLLDTL